jgi:hypothetical protein
MTKKLLGFTHESMSSLFMLADINKGNTNGGKVPLQASFPSFKVWNVLHNAGGLCSHILNMRFFKFRSHI